MKEGMALPDVEEGWTRRKPEFPRDTLPLRVIDVPATLSPQHVRLGHIVLVKPEGWDFHTLSHTWSQHIRHLSRQVNKAVQTSASDSYEEAFKTLDLRKHHAYSHIKEFLEVLQMDGVRHAWLDAVCINQGCREEVDREIPHMGAYYANSQACYVQINGFGHHDGYYYRCPTPLYLGWMNRVWTLQEFLLPKKLYFVIAMECWMEEYFSWLPPTCEEFKADQQRPEQNQEFKAGQQPPERNRLVCSLCQCSIPDFMMDYSSAGMDSSSFLKNLRHSLSVEEF